MLLTIFFLFNCFASIFMTNVTDIDLHERWEKCMDSRVVGGDNINIEDAPFQLYVIIRMSFFSVYGCGGSVLTRKAAITARHCVSDPPIFPIDVSKVTILSGSPTYNEGKKHRVTKILLYSYKEQTILDSDDIALLFVKEPFVISSYTKPINLPTKQPPVDLPTEVSGWGLTAKWDGVAQQHGYPSTHLKRARVPIVDTETCRKIFRKIFEGDEEGPVPDLSDKFVCAGDPDMRTDACTGDSGGPLYHNNTLYGIVSFGYGCAWPCRPGVYTNVYYYVNWIKKSLRKEGEKIS